MTRLDIMYKDWKWLNIIITVILLLGFLLYIEFYVLKPNYENKKKYKYYSTYYSQFGDIDFLTFEEWLARKADLKE